MIGGFDYGDENDWVLVAMRMEDTNWDLSTTLSHIESNHRKAVPEYWEALQ